MPPDEDIECPFCHETEFDKPGLKFHLLQGYCQEFEEADFAPPNVKELTMDEWASAYNKIGLVEFYINKALKHAEGMTPEMVAACPQFVKYSLAGMASQLKREADWCSLVKQTMREEATKEPESILCENCGIEVPKII